MPGILAINANSKVPICQRKAGTKGDAAEGHWKKLKVVLAQQQLGWAKTKTLIVNGDFLRDIGENGVNLSVCAMLKYINKINSFLRKKLLKKKPHSVPDAVDKSKWTGKDFEFLIVGNIQIIEQEYDTIMTPKSIEWTKLTKNKWSIYKVGQESYSFSHEDRGILLSFSDTMNYEMARQIADEVIENIKTAGQIAYLSIVVKPVIYLMTK